MVNCFFFFNQERSIARVRAVFYGLMVKHLSTIRGILESPDLDWIAL